MRIVFDRPRVIVIEQFASAPECEWLIQRGRPGLARAMVYRGASTPQAADTRTNTETSFTIFNADVMINLIRERMSSATRAATSFFEVTKLLHYEPGQQFALHGDFLQPSTPELVQEIQRRGQRAATFLTYLNDDFEGGETEFPRISFRFKGKRGDALLFSNTDRAGAPDYETVHAGLPPTSGEKWLLSQWIRSRPIDAVTAGFAQPTRSASKPGRQAASRGAADSAQQIYSACRPRRLADVVLCEIARRGGDRADSGVAAQAAPHSVASVPTTVDRAARAPATRSPS